MAGDSGHATTSVNHILTYSTFLKATANTNHMVNVNFNATFAIKMLV